MAIILLKQKNGKLYELKYKGKKRRKNKEIKLEENSFLFLQEKSIYNNPIAYWFFRVVFEFSNIITRHNISNKKEAELEIKLPKKIQIFYSNILSENITIEVDGNTIDVSGLKLSSIVIDGVTFEESKEIEKRYKYNENITCVTEYVNNRSYCRMKVTLYYTKVVLVHENFEEYALNFFSKYDEDLNQKQ